MDKDVTHLILNKFPIYKNGTIGLGIYNKQLSTYFSHPKRVGPIYNQFEHMNSNTTTICIGQVVSTQKDNSILDHNLIQNYADKNFSNESPLEDWVLVDDSASSND